MFVDVGDGTAVRVAAADATEVGEPAASTGCGAVGDGVAGAIGGGAACVVGAAANGDAADGDDIAADWQPAKRTPASISAAIAQPARRSSAIESPPGVPFSLMTILALMLERHARDRGLAQRAV